MSDSAPQQDAINKLLETAQRCRRLADNIIDRPARERLLGMAKECEAKVEELRLPAPVLTVGR